jgi:hypothetical protein
VLAARAVIGSAALALLALTVVHLLKRDLDPSRTMISRYALGPYGWLMALCFAAWAAASALLFVALAAAPSSSLDRVGQILLLAASIGLTMAAGFPMDPVETPRRQMSFSGRMHGIAFLVGVPALVLAASILSLSQGRYGSSAAVPLLLLTAAIWLSLIAMIALGAMVGPDHGPNPRIPWLFGFVNRLLMVSYSPLADRHRVADGTLMVVTGDPSHFRRQFPENRTLQPFANPRTGTRKPFRKKFLFSKSPARRARTNIVRAPIPPKLILFTRWTDVGGPEAHPRDERHHHAGAHVEAATYHQMLHLSFR